MRNNYLSLKGYFILLVLSLQLFNAKAQQTYTFNYTGAMQTINLPAGIYEIECWGANGSNGSWTNVPGGKGGYSKGTYTISSATTIYVCVGGVGVRNLISSGSSGGGYNGGGDGYDTYGTGGGGATHVSTASGLLSNTLVRNGLIIAAGGGGAASGWASAPGLPGNGGGLTGSDGTQALSTPGLGGTQTAGGTQASTTYGNSNGTAGLGGSGLGNQGCGGGGGWYGGGGGPHASNGGGGSGYIAGVTGGISAQISQTGFVTNPIVTGHGLALIKELCNITLTASGSNSLNPSICSGQSLTLTTNGISNYAWSTGNTTSPTIAVSPTTTTVYSLSATSPSNCTAYKSMTVIVNATAPVLSLTTSPSSGTVCLGQTATLTAAGAVSYSWAGGNGNVQNGQTFSPTATSNYTVTGVNGCGTGSAVASITVSALPVTAVASNTLICSGTPATLTAGGANSFTWTSTSASSTNTNYIISPTANTTYSLYGVTGPCAGSTVITISTKPLPTLNITVTNSNICSGNSANLSVVGNATAYVWNPTGQNGTSISVSPTVNTLYSVTGTNSVNCVNTALQVVIVNANPVVSASVNNPVVCSGGAATLSASGANTYSWNTTAATATTLVNPTANTTYSVTGTNTNNCFGTATVGVSIFVPTIGVSGNAVICIGTSTTVSADGADTYHWSNNSISPGISVSPTLTTVYTVTGSVTDPVSNVVCDATNSLQVTVNPRPVVTATADHNVICSGNSAVLIAGGANTYTWTGGSGAVQSLSTTVTPITDQTYSVTGIDGNGCKNSAIISIQVSPCVGINSVAANTANLLVYPNPSNGEITISSDQAISLQISNELGQVIKIITLGKTGETATVSNLAHGVYFITGQNANGSVKQKLIITK